MGFMQAIKESLKYLKDSWQETRLKDKIWFILFCLVLIGLAIGGFIVVRYL